MTESKTAKIIVNGSVEEREIEVKSVKGFTTPIFCRKDTYDLYIAKEIYRSYGKLSVEDNVALDIGGNIGLFSRWAIDNNAKKVYAFEPESFNCEMFQLNCPEEEIVLCQSAVINGEQPFVDFYISTSGKNSGNYTTRKTRGRTISTVSAVSIQKVLEETNPDVAKIDCEGGEYEIYEAIADFPKLKEVVFEIHLTVGRLENAIRLDAYFLNNGWEAFIAPTLDNSSLWQTIAGYRRKES